MRLVYEKPTLQYWTATELDAVEASMSSTGSGSGLRFEWDTSARTSTYSSFFTDYTVEFIAATIITVVTKNAKYISTKTENVINFIAGVLFGSTIKTAYYTNEEWLLKEQPLDPSYSGMGAVVGYVDITKVYADEAHKTQTGDPLLSYSFSETVPSKVKNLCPCFNKYSNLEKF